VKRPLLAGAIFALALLAPAVQAQGSRADLLRQATAAYDDFDIPRAARFARAALDPSIGARDSTWARGVHLLTQLLIEDNQSAQATLWAKWAMRIEPTLQIDSVRFLGEVVTTLREARAAAVRTTADDATRETFAWPTATFTGTEARLRLAPGANGVSVLVTGVGLLTEGPGITLQPGTYDMQVNATGFLPLRITREALPGVTTEFAFTLTSAAVAANTLAADVVARVNRSVVPLNVTRFGAPAAVCAVGAVAGGGRLVVTSYTAIRGADGIASGPGDGVRVAAWNVAANLAVLVVPNAPQDTLPLTDNVVAGQALFGVTLQECRTPSQTRVLLSSWEGRPAGTLNLSAPLTGGVAGAPIVDVQGNIAGVWNTGPNAVPAAVVAGLVATARANVAAGRLLTPQAVATQERHRYGTIVIAADIPEAAIKVTPLEAWHWPALAAEATGTLTLNAPAGRYRVEASVPGVPTRTLEVTVLPGERGRVAVDFRVVAGGGDVAEPRRGMPRWAWIAVIGGGAVAAVALGGGGSSGGGGGSISISVPNP
jgi:hypothetical protein